ncbi:MAG: hypothetical protein P1V97_36960 [Planctomycetota bacterium]|nr:hypothetical protein [Planctomycetota bacterium]
MNTFALETTLERVWGLIKNGPPSWLAALFALAMLLTGLKLWRTAKLRGWVNGRIVSLETISQKGRESLPKELFWFSTDEAGKEGGERIRVSKERWDKMKVGQRLNIVTVPGEGERYLMNGLFASPAQFLFDLTLLFGEASMFFWTLSRWIKGVS